MINKREYVTLSLELHLFFARIMKEHSLFLEAGFTPKNSELSCIADRFKEEFQSLLRDVVCLSDGIVSRCVLASGEVVTEFTLAAEKKTEYFTGIDIDQEITRNELCLSSSCDPKLCDEMYTRVCQINQRAAHLLEGLIAFKQQLLKDVLCCTLFTLNYPLLIEHILREAKLYQGQLLALENGCDPRDNAKETELFWDRIMMEHAQFIRGLLDPTENDLIMASNDFANDYARLLKKAKEANDCTMECVTDDTLRQTIAYRDFKATGTKGILECEVRSIILPLLGDHVLREANHYIRLLAQFK